MEDLHAGIPAVFPIRLGVTKSLARTNLFAVVKAYCYGLLQLN